MLETIRTAHAPDRVERRTWKFFWGKLGEFLIFGAALAALTLLMAGLRVGSWAPRGVEFLDGISSELVAQIVPATVIAIFVFAVGVAFVVAQVVPPVRGTRADGALRGRRLTAAIAPAPAFILGSVILVMFECFHELAAALLVGSVLYIAGSVVCMLSILKDATDPSAFKALLVKRGVEAVSWGPSKPPAEFFGGTHAEALKSVQTPRDPENVAHRSFWALQEATDSLYDIVRTFRGWARVSASKGDSRELHEALDGLLRLVHEYSERALPSAHWVATVPKSYWRHVGDPRELSPLHNPGALPITAASRAEGWPLWANPWAPPLLADAIEIVPPEIASLLADETELARLRIVQRPFALREAFGSLPSTWFANEVGRAVVRAVEFGVDAGGLLERDVSRLLNCLENAANIFGNGAFRAAKQVPAAGLSPYPSHEWSAGVIVKYLVEVGLGARRCAPDLIDWYYEPCVRLVRLHQGFRAVKLIGGGPSAEATAGTARRLSIGTAAGVLRVSESILAAEERADARTPRSWQLSQLRQVLSSPFEPAAPVLVLDAAGRTEAKGLAEAEAGPLASNDHREVHAADKNRLSQILAALLKPNHDL